MDFNQPHTSTRQAVITSLAVVGFIALVAAGIALAVYSTRFVPTVVNNIGAAAVYLGSLFTPAGDDSGLVVVETPGDSTTIPFDTETPADSPTTSVPADSKPVATTPGPKTTSVAPIGGTATAPATTLYGRPDLLVTVSAIGYLNTASADSFIASPSVPDGKRPAIRFTVKNAGTNVSGSWRFEATIPTRNTYDYTSPIQQSLLPGESIDYTLGFDRAREGNNQPITIFADSEKKVVESNEDNNTISLTITVLG